MFVYAAALLDFKKKGGGEWATSPKGTGFSKILTNLFAIFFFLTETERLTPGSPRPHPSLYYDKILDNLAAEGFVFI